MKNTEIAFYSFKQFRYLSLHLGGNESVRVTLPSHIFFVQVKPGALYTTGRWGRV